MDLNVSAAQQALANPSSGLKDLIAHAPTETGDALASIAPGITTSANSTSSDPAVSSGSEKEWTVVGSDASKKRGAASERLQIVDEEKQFTKGLNSSLEKWGLIDKGFGYDVVAVFGSQSTGKSTLLNRLFGTTFDVMDEKARKQTTKGIWMCKADEASIMVMDVEGTDGRERGEDQDFERKSALFSLASSEVLLVNIWEHQVGLYQGANMGLLKTVFEVNLGLFGQAKTSGKEKTLLMFVIRDHVGSTPLANLEATLTQDMERIWSSLSKPDALANANLTDYFDLAFTTLPHKVLMPDQFETAVQDLRKRFVDRSREDFVFKPSYHKRIPADGVAFYMEQIWDQVQSNADLDIPTQQELLAQFRCDEIAAVATETFVSSIKTVRRRVETGEVVSDLGSSMTSWLDIALARFDRDASRYHSGVYTKKRVDLVAVLHAALNPLFLGHVKNLHTSVLKDFRKGLEEGLKGREYDFGEIVRKGREKAELSFKEGAEGVKLKDTDWQSDDEFAILKEDINLIAGQCRSDETRKMVNTIERNIKKQLSEPIEFYLNKPTPDLWDKVLGQFLETLTRAEETYLAKAKSFNCTEEENIKALEVVRRRAWLALRSKIDEQTNDTVLLSKLRFAFEERFRYDEQGVPRVWKPEDDIDAAFKKAKDETLVLIPLYAAIKPFNAELLPSNIPSDTSDSLHDPDAEFDFEDSLTILTPMKVADLEGKFRREADALYVEAKRSMVVSRAQIPVWVWGAMVFLGFNEFKAVVTNPLYFTFLLILLVSAYFVHQFGLSGPLLQVTGSVYREVHRQVVEKLRETFAEPGPPTHSPAHTEQKAPILNAPINATGRPQGPDGVLLQE